LQNALARFRYLHLGLATILAYVAAKLVLTDIWHPPILASLAVVVGALVLAAGASFLVARTPRPAADHVN
jgi:tellurite resistance protein TerC